MDAMATIRIQSRPRRLRRRGFTLVEAAITTAIIGFGVMAMLELIATGTKHNVEGAELTTAINLAKNVREYTLGLRFDQVRNLNGTTYSTPIDSRGQTIGSLSGWTQTVAVQPVEPPDLTASSTDPTPDVIRVTIDVAHNNQHAGELSWYRFAATP
jgi:type II secretory pathway pseudopilin PulG